MTGGSEEAKEGMRFALARAIGCAYDGYADPVDTPNNWARAITAADEVLETLMWPTNEMLKKGAEEYADEHESEIYAAFDVFCVMIQAIKDGK